MARWTDRRTYRRIIGNKMLHSLNTILQQPGLCCMQPAAKASMLKLLFSVAFAVLEWNSHIRISHIRQASITELHSPPLFF